MVSPDRSMAHEMNRASAVHYKKLMQEAEDAAMADGEIDDEEKLALENPKERVRKMLAQSPWAVAADKKKQSRYSDVFFRLPPPGLFYAEAILQPSSAEEAYKPLPGDTRPRWLPAYMPETPIM